MSSLMKNHIHVVQVELALRIFFLVEQSQKNSISGEQYVFICLFLISDNLTHRKSGDMQRVYSLHISCVSGGLLNVKILLLLKKSIENKKAFQIQPTLSWRGNSSTYFQFYADSLVLQPVKKMSHYVSFLRVLYITQVVGKVLAKAA